VYAVIHRPGWAKRIRNLRRGRLAAAGIAVLSMTSLSSCRWPGHDGKQVDPSPTATRPAGLVAPAATLPDIAYAHTSAAQRLDLSLPARRGSAIPLVIIIHGGAFAGGDKKDEPGIVAAVNAAGWAAASINYRLSGEARFPAGVQDAKAAVRWLRANASAYGVDPDRFAAWGTSAGAHLAAMIGVTGSVSDFLDDAALGNAKTSSGVSAVVDWYGPTDFLTMDRQNVDPGGCRGTALPHDPADSPESIWLGGAIQTIPAEVKAASPISYLSSEHRPPPFLIVHGKRDCTVPVGQSMQLQQALVDVGADVTLRILPRAGHADPQIERTQLKPAIGFLRDVFSR
jgi:acetyl esterase/lipase